MPTNNESILVLVEIAGFRSISETLAYGCAHVGFGPDDAQHALRRSIVRLIYMSTATAPFEITSWGSDSFVLRFLNITEAVSVASVILQRAYFELMNGTALLKPIIAIAPGVLTMQDTNPLGVIPVSLHEACAAKQPPFSLLVAESLPHDMIPENSFVIDEGNPTLSTQSGVAYRRYLLQPTGTTHALPFVKLLSLTNNLTLFDGLVAHDLSESVNLGKQLRLQSQKSIRIVGGGPLLNSAEFHDIGRFHTSLLESRDAIEGFSIECLVMCFANEGPRSYYWLLFNALALERFSKIYKVRVLTISRKDIKPMGFTIVDDRYVFFGLRHYNTQFSMPTTKYSLCLESRSAAEGFNGVFYEYWRRAKERTPNQLRNMAERLRGLPKKYKANLRNEVEELFKPQCAEAGKSEAQPPPYSLEGPSL